MPPGRSRRVRIERHDTVTAFLGAAGAFLRAREAEHCLILGISASLLDRPSDPDDEPPYLAVVRDGPRVVAVGFQTPPWQMVLSEIDDEAALGLIVADRRADSLPAVVGPAEHVGRFAARWAEERGLATRLAMRERIFRLTNVVRPRAATGAMRLAGPVDAGLLADWLAAFSIEALGEKTVPESARMADRWLTPSPARAMYLWEDGGPVAVCGTSGPTPTGIRVAPVYTPPDLRGRGYASNLVAAVSQAQLDRGRNACFLYTDLANPTSNHVYQAIGYEPVRDVDQWVFGD